MNELNKRLRGVFKADSQMESDTMRVLENDEQKTPECRNRVLRVIVFKSLFVSILT